MATVTVGGGGSAAVPVQTQILVTTLDNTMSTAGLVAGGALNAIANSSAAAATIIGGTPATDVAQTVPALPNSVTAVLVENSSPTTMNNQVGASGQTIFSSTGGLTFDDVGSSDTIIAGGGVNNITFDVGSQNNYYMGDCINQINVNSTVASSTATIIGTASSIDTITGSTVSGANIYYQSASGSEAFIDPGAHNATVIGTAGGTETVSVFGGVAFTGSLSVIDGHGYFQGGSAGGNIMASSTLGSTTLVGGGANDVLTSNARGDYLIAGLGAETLQSAASATGGVRFFASPDGTTTIFMHPTIPGAAGCNSVVGGNPNVPGWANGVENATVWDFVSGTDKLVLESSVVGASATIGGGNSVVGGQSVAYSTVTTSNGSVFTFMGITIQSGDIISR